MSGSEVAEIIEDLRRGRQFFKNDKSGIIHFSVGRVSFEGEKLFDNVSAFIKALSAAKPPASKGRFIKNLTICSSMGPGIRVNPELA